MVQKRIVIFGAVFLFGLIVVALLLRRSFSQSDTTFAQAESAHEPTQHVSQLPPSLAAPQQTAGEPRLDDAFLISDDPARESAPSRPEAAITVSPLLDTNAVELLDENSAFLPQESVPIPRREIETIAFALRLYFMEFGVYPHGTPLQIARTLEGDNPKNIRFLKFPRTTGNGAFLDPWKTPYSIAISATGELQMTSAGPNRTHGDDDDCVVRVALNR